MYGYFPLFSVCFGSVPGWHRPSYTPLWAAMGKFMMLNAFNSRFWANPLAVLAFATCWQWASIASDRPLPWNRTCELEWFAKASGKEQRNLSMLFWGCFMTESPKPSLTGEIFPPKRMQPRPNYNTIIISDEMGPWLPQWLPLPKSLMLFSKNVNFVEPLKVRTSRPIPIWRRSWVWLGADRGWPRGRERVAWPSWEGNCVERAAVRRKANHKVPEPRNHFRSVHSLPGDKATIWCRCSVVSGSKLLWAC